MNLISMKGRGKIPVVMFLGGLVLIPCVAVLSAVTTGSLSAFLYYVIFACLAVAFIGLASLLLRPPPTLCVEPTNVESQNPHDWVSVRETDYPAIEASLVLGRLQTAGFEARIYKDVIGGWKATYVARFVQVRRKDYDAARQLLDIK